MNEKYLKAPWHDTRKELPEIGHNRCVVYSTHLNSEFEAIFHKGKDGWKDYFTAFGRSFDYDYITYWRYYSEQED